ncbi:hypothetical protein [Frateuria defendens]|uniref:hypothetical protein n=1 Tax=Frateuria defendens TaxID=2219559 RepID=UPI0012940BD7|nr:hypothetical protein [Frateuria defendens]
MDIARLATLGVIGVSVSYANAVYWKRALAKPAGSPMDPWAILAEMRKTEPTLARRWLAAQWIGIAAVLYLLIRP